VEQVFDHFKPNCDVELEKEDGSTKKENFRFAGLGDFDLKSLTLQSSYLKNLNVDKDAYLRMIKQLKTNKSLKNVIENPETRNAFINALKTLASDLEENQEA